MDEFEQPKYDPEAADRRMKRATFAKQLDAFLKTEGALAYATMSSRDGKLIHGTGYLFASGDSQAMPGFEIAAEDYRRLARLAKVGPAPVVEMASVVHYDDSDRKAYNRSEEHTSELQSLIRISYAVFCLKKKNNIHTT